MSHCTTFAEAGRLVDAGRHAPFLLTLCEEDENELHITICCAKAEPNAQTPSTGNAALDDILAHYLCTFERSKLLDYLPRAIDVHLIPDGTDAPASWKHYGIYTQNQIIDIVALSEPTVRTFF